MIGEILLPDTTIGSGTARTLGIIVAVCNAIGTLWLTAVCVWAARRSRLLRHMWATIAAFAAVFTIAFIWLAVDIDSSATWARWVRPLQAVFWFVAAWPGLAITRQTRRVVAELDEMVAAVDEHPG